MKKNFLESYFCTECIKDEFLHESLIDPDHPDYTPSPMPETCIVCQGVLCINDKSLDSGEG